NRRPEMNQIEDAGLARTPLALLLVACLVLALAGKGALGATGREEPSRRGGSGQVESNYVCPMDPDVISKSPGICPKCGMALRLKEPSSPAASRKNNAGQRGQGRIPDTPVYDQDGRKLRFFSDLVKGKTVAVNFIFTTCTTICPPLTATFRKVQQDLGARVGKDIHLISISVDPSTDVPERLKAFAAKFNAGPGWSFVTGGKQDIDGLLLALGAKVDDKNDHTPMILVGNESAGNWTRTYGLSPPKTLVKVITDAAEARPATSQGDVKTPVPGGAQATVPERSAAAKPAESAAKYFPNVELLTQENKPVHFFDDLLKGKIVVINFAFSTCTGVCPPMTANLAKVQEYLGDRVGRDINMITISVDPLIDTPEVLKKYASNFKVKPGWYFLTGKKENVDLVLKKLGGYVADKAQHSGVLIIGNVETGTWSKMLAMADASEIANAVRKIADSKR
ncbi:MAG TPA: SCO family protein, partial [Blastocatellia bacterium]|nr:SCO family protein [Blastocatellia bacterium]